MPAGNADPSGHLVLSLFLGLACAPMVETRFLKLAMSLLDFHIEYPLVLSRFCFVSPNEIKFRQSNLSVWHFPISLT